MEQDRYPECGPDPGLCGCDRDFFQRVWRRVMPEETEGCPIELAPEQSTSLAVSNTPDNSFAMPAAAAREETYKAEGGIRCFGADSAVYGDELQNFICHELSDWRTYQALAMWSGMGAFRVFSGISADEYRHAKRLSSAYFLISGVRFWPHIPLPSLTDSYFGMLRRRFSEEQRGEAEYLAAAAETSDPCLHELYIELAGDEANHARLIRSLLELQI